LKRGLKYTLFPFLLWFKEVNNKTLPADLIAGLTGAVIVLPQGVAFALIAGLPPIYGLYTAMITPVIAALFGSSYHLISGPTTAISLVVFSSISGTGAEPFTESFVNLALVLTVMAGVIQLAMGIGRLGVLVNFVSHTVVIGFTAGAGILIAGSQLKHLIGIKMTSGLPFHEGITHIANNLGATHYPTLIVGLGTLAIAIIAKKIWHKLPHMLLAMIGGSVLAYAFGGEDSGIKLVGEMTSKLPSFKAPNLDIENIKQLSSSAFAVALLGLIEAVAISKAIATKTNQRIDGNQEFIGQGLSNMVGGFFQCYAGSGSFTRSGINHESGAKTPLAAIFAAAFLTLIIIFVAPLTAYLPMSAMAGVILLVSYNLIDFKHIKGIVKISGREAVVLGITFISTLVLDLEFAIYIGVIFSLVLYLQKTSRPRMVLLGVSESNPLKVQSVIRKKNVNELQEVKIIRLDGSLFFGSVDHVRQKIRKASEGSPKFVLLECSGMNLIDLAGAEMLVQEANLLASLDSRLLLSDLKRPAREYLIKGNYWRGIGSDWIFETSEQALLAIKKLSDLESDN
jgi:SulP family sulfate permease